VRDAKKEKETIVSQAIIEADDMSHKEKEKSEKDSCRKKKMSLKKSGKKPLPLKREKTRTSPRFPKKFSLR
jgi:hypothetical protein